MRTYLSKYQGGTLPKLASELGVGDGYIDAVAEKFNSEAANWVWDEQTAQARIDHVIIEYELMKESSRFGISATTVDNLIEGWINTLKRIQISHESAKDHTSCKELIDLMVNLERTRKIYDKNRFLEALRTQGDEFNRILAGGRELFKKIAGLWLSNLTTDQCDDVYTRMPSGQFAIDRSPYLKTCEVVVNEYCKSLGRTKLREFWKEKTGTETPDAWSTENKTPIMVIVPKDEIQKAQKSFDTINNQNPNNEDAEDALKYLKEITWWKNLSDKAKIEKSFAQSMIGEYSRMITADEVRSMLISHVSDPIYKWWSNNLVRLKIKELAQNRYETQGVNQALEIIDNLKDEEKIKEWLKRLVRGSMEVGLEIISSDGEKK